ncbi:MAG: hypothetical protein ACOVVK_08960 [Elsteraceae bacterium]
MSVETVPLVLALYIAVYMLVSASVPAGPQPWLQLPGLIATGAAVLLMIAALLAGVLWATTFGAVFARYLAVPMAVILACIVWIGLILKCFRDVAEGSRRGRLIMAVVGVAATGILVYGSHSAVERWRFVVAQAS